jgi:dephospho-CoA kinase
VRASELVGDYPFAVVDVPLLFETGAEKDFDRVIVTACAPEIQLARLIERGLTDAAARQRLAAQWPTDKKIAGADFVVTTDGTFEETNRQVDQIYRSLTT